MKDQHQNSAYAASGVNIDAANTAKKRIKELVKNTYNNNVLSEIGHFGGLFRFDPSRYSEPVLVSSADGVGTKLKVAFMSGIHSTVGHDLVSHCVNDILVQGAIPLFFLDYIATGVLNPDIVEQIVYGLAKGCKEAGCVLIGGETAEMPDFYSPGEYDLAGVIVGVVEKDRIIDGSAICKGDIVLGLPSMGLHTNGYSLARKIFFKNLGMQIDTRVDELGCTVGEELLKPHKCYLQSILPCLNDVLVTGLAHITGGGLLENIPRILPGGLGVEITKGTWPVLPVFEFMQKSGGISDREMYRVFNMGIGMVLIVRPENEKKVLKLFDENSERVYKIGRVVDGKKEVKIV